MTQPVTTALANPYWDAVSDLLTTDRYYGGPCLGSPLDWDSPRPGRSEFVGRYSWTVADPITVAFVAQHAGPDCATGKVIDPLAGSGYWALLLRQRGISVIATDRRPPVQGLNHWHKESLQYVDIGEVDAVEAVLEYGAGRTLLLSWPPYDRPIGQQVLAAYQGDRVIYLGETEGGCCGNDDLFDELARNWTQVAAHQPVRWWGIRDVVTVHERRTQTLAIEEANHG